jgi:hypothetical protein
VGGGAHNVAVVCGHYGRRGGSGHRCTAAVVAGPAHTGEGKQSAREGERWGMARDILVAACRMYNWTREQRDIYEVDLRRKGI